MRGKSNMENRKIHSQPKYTANRIHGQDPWIQIGSGPDGPYLGQSAPASAIRSRSAVPYAR